MELPSHIEQYVNEHPDDPPDLRATRIAASLALDEIANRFRKGNMTFGLYESDLLRFLNDQGWFLVRGNMILHGE